MPEPPCLQIPTSAASLFGDLVKVTEPLWAWEPAEGKVRRRDLGSKQASSALQVSHTSRLQERDPVSKNKKVKVKIKLNNERPQDGSESKGTGHQR